MIHTCGKVVYYLLPRVCDSQKNIEIAKTFIFGPSSISDHYM